MNDIEILNRAIGRCRPLGDCWHFDGTNVRGYGRIGVRGATVTLHRFAYEVLIGEIPDGLHLDHLCRNRSCVNPWHLEPVTQRVNTLRGASFAAENARKTHCLRGHPLSGSNLYPSKRGYRLCRICNLAAQKERRDRIRRDRSAERGAA